MDHNAVSGDRSKPLMDTESNSNTVTASPQTLQDSSQGPVVGGKKAPSSTVRNRALVHDAVVNVVLSSRYIGAGNISPGLSRKFPGFESQVKAKMIISIWTLENQRYFTLTFTSASNAPFPPTRSHSRAVSRAPNALSPTKSFPSSPTSPGFFCGCGSSPSSILGSSSGVPLSISPFPPLGAPGDSDVAMVPSALEKIARMKDGMINAMEIPVFVMWKDESLMIPNAAAARLLYKKADPISEDGYGLMSRFRLYTPDFERELERDEMPLVRLCRTQKPFSKWKIGVIDSNLQRRHFDVSGEGIVDDKTGEFLAGIITFTDVTEYTDIIKTQSEENDQQFQLICDTMPQLVCLVNSLRSQRILIVSFCPAVDNYAKWPAWEVCLHDSEGMQLTLNRLVFTAVVRLYRFERSRFFRSWMAKPLSSGRHARDHQKMESFLGNG